MTRYEEIIKKRNEHFLCEIMKELHSYFIDVFVDHKTIENEYFLITLPFLDKHFDNIEIAIKFGEAIHTIYKDKKYFKNVEETNKIIILEYYIEDLKSLYFNDKFREICKCFGLEYDLGIGKIYKEFVFQGIAQNFIRFLEAVILISNL